MHARTTHRSTALAATTLLAAGLAVASGGRAEAARAAPVPNGVGYPAATRALARSLGPQAVVDLDATTGTVRQVARLDGFLTAPSGISAASVTLGYVRAHLAALGLTAADLATLHLARDYVDIAGQHHLSWTQSAAGVPVFGHGLQAAVTGDGRLLTVGGAPVTHLHRTVAAASRVGTAPAAIGVARAALDEPRAAGPLDRAARVLFVTSGGTRPGWAVTTMSAARPASTVVDAATGSVLYRRGLSADADQPADPAGGIAYRYFPGHRPRGGVQEPVTYPASWLATTATRLSGNNSHTYSDIDDDDRADPNEEVGPRSGNRWDYPLVPFHLRNISFCDHPYPCSWNPDQPNSWRTNRAQNAAQVFFYVNTWHDHLLAAPIGFTEAAGNFQKVNSTGQGHGGDAVDTQTDDGADTDHGLPDGSHIDNANMATPPDGQAPRMQMYLQHQPGTSYPDGDPFSPTNVGDEADTVYHEYTHGLSNRLVVDAAGESTLTGRQGGAMGEGWSDWYAMDYLVAERLQADRKDAVDLVIFQYDGEGIHFDRTEPMDCEVGESAPRCNGGETGHRGGYTYADYGLVLGFPEVHADGEIWSQTLWDLRERLGSTLAESLVTRAMELAAADPSFVDMRNAILLADRSLYRGRDKAAIWAVFAHRGLGYYATSNGAEDITPHADFHTPPGA